MYTLLAAALLTAAPAADAHIGRFDRARAMEAQRAMLTTFSTTRETISTMYNWASSSTTLDRAITQQKALDVGRQVGAAEAAWENMVKALPTAQAGLVHSEATSIREAFASATKAATRLKTEASAASPSRVEVRYLTSEAYGALALAHEQQLVIGKRLGITPAEPAGARIR